jgi:cold shock protein
MAVARVHPSTRADRLPASGAKSQGDGMSQGTVKWYSTEKRFGFIVQEEGPDMFFHKNGLAPDIHSVTDGQAVEYEVREGRKGPEAFEVKPLPV